MLHSKQWHYSLHRDFQNCNSTRRSPTGFFSSNSTRVSIHPHTTYMCTLHYSTSREFSIQNPILHAEDRKLFEYYYYIPEGKETFIPKKKKKNSMNRRQGDLLEIHPCVLQDLPRTFQTFQSFQTFQTFQSFMTFQPFQAILQVPVSPGNPPHYSILRLECIFYIFYGSIGFHRKLHRVPVEQYELQTFYKHYILQRKGDVVISVKRASVKMSR